MRLVIQYDQPDLLMDTRLFIYTMQGQLIYSQQAADNTDMQLSISQMGLTAGIYLYKVQIKSENSKYVSCSGKIIVAE